MLGGKGDERGAVRRARLNRGLSAVSHAIMAATFGLSPLGHSPMAGIASLVHTICRALRHLSGTFPAVPAGVTVPHPRDVAAVTAVRPCMHARVAGAPRTRGTPPTQVAHAVSGMGVTLRVRGVPKISTMCWDINYIIYPAVFTPDCARRCRHGWESARVARSCARLHAHIHRSIMYAAL